MGQGSLLEHGSHDDLLSQDGEYARLVRAQKLRESGDESTVLAGEETDVEKATREEVPLGRRSVAGETFEQKRQSDAEEVPKEAIGIIQLLKRMATLHREGWSSYIFGSVFAVSKSMIISTRFFSFINPIV